ncbi:MAG TPA: type II toxin-antitoxin system prevent-host-death family antitoxin [Anaerolineales bacterium]|nr:type II toxin-antitoxin system prevent-host-death family antitoxin [Anaerolineales bacterium]
MAEVTVGVRELKSQLSKYLRHVKAGRTILITEHGKTVGRIVPPEISLEDKLEAMRRAGLIRWSGKKLTPTKPIARLRGNKSIADIIIENRE